MVSVIITTYNNKNGVKEAIDSVLSQTYKDIEIIVVDDGSIDDTEDFLKDYIQKRKIIFKRQENKGVSSARNVGFQLSKGEYINFLDGDDTLNPEKIKAQVEFLKNHPDISVVYCDSDIIINNKKMDFTYKELVGSFSGEVLNNLLERNFIALHSALTKREAIKEVGLFDESLRHAEDYDLWIRIANSHKYSFIDKPMVIYKKNAKGLSSNVKNQCYSVIKVLKKNLPKNKNSKKYLTKYYYSAAIDMLSVKDFKSAKYFYSLFYKNSENIKIDHKILYIFYNFAPHSLYLFKKIRIMLKTLISPSNRLLIRTRKFKGEI